MQQKRLFLSDLAENVGEYIVSNFFGQDTSYFDLLSSGVMDHIVNAIDEGILITDGKNKIVNVNQFAEKALNATRKECLGKGIDVFGRDLEIVGPDSKSGGKRNTRPSKYTVTASPIFIPWPGGRPGASNAKQGKAGPVSASLQFQRKIG